MPLLKRIFGQGKSKASNTLVALCIGNYSRLTLSIVGHEAHQLEALLAQDGTVDDGSPVSSPNQLSSKASGLSGHPPSFKGFRHLLQHFGGGAPASPHADEEADSQQQLAQFLKQLGGYPTVSFVAATEDGLVSRDKVLAKLTKLFKQSTAPVVLVVYCGPSDERGNWRLASQASTAAPVGSSSSNMGSGGAGAGAGSSVVGFREVSMLWQRHRKHSQRLVLLLDCPNSGYWVAALRMLSKAEQLELSLGIQASDCSLPDLQATQLTYQPGIFLQCFLTNNKWRRPQQQLQKQSGATGKGTGSVSGPTTTTTTAGWPEPWLPGMLPTYYATWLNDNLVDYGVALRFYNLQVRKGTTGGGLALATGDPARPPTFLDPMEAIRGWRSSTTVQHSRGSSKSLLRRSRLQGEDTVTSPSSNASGNPFPWSQRSVTVGRPSQDVGDTERLASAADPQLMLHQSSVRAFSVPDAARRRLGLLSELGASSSQDSPQAGSNLQPIVGSPTNPMVDRVRLSTPLGDWGGVSNLTTSSALEHRRYPTLPGDDSLYKMDVQDGSGSTLPTFSPAASHYDVGLSRSARVDAYSTTAAPPPDDAVLRSAQAAASTSALNSSSIPQNLGSALFSRSSQPAGSSAPADPQPRHTQRSVSALAAARRFTAVLPQDVYVEEDSGSGVVGATAAAALGTEDDGLQVQASARSDTVALAWAQRSTLAERCLMEDERGCGVTSSFTEANRGHGFANELFGALHEVATDRRLRARRAPLEGDESLDTMMEDADLDRPASLASLPSAMLPRALPTGSSSSQTCVATPTHRMLLCTTAAPSMSMATRSVEGSDLAGRASSLLTTGPAGRDGELNSPALRNPSRLFLVSTNFNMPDAPLGLDGDTRRGQEGEEGGDGPYDEEDEDQGLHISINGHARQQHQQQVRHQQQQQQDLRRMMVQGKSKKAGLPLAGTLPQGQQHQQQQPMDGSFIDEALNVLLENPESGTNAELLVAPSPPASAEWGPTAHSPLHSMTSSIAGSAFQQERHRNRNLILGSSSQNLQGGSVGTSGSIRRNVLKAQVSIADTVDLDSASLPVVPRRPGRFEMAGSEASSFVFGDDQERYEMLKLLREHTGDKGEDEELDETAAVVAASGRPDSAGRVGEMGGGDTGSGARGAGGAVGGGSPSGRRRAAADAGPCDLNSGLPVGQEDGHRVGAMNAVEAPPRLDSTAAAGFSGTMLLSVDNQTRQRSQLPEVGRPGYAWGPDGGGGGAAVDGRVTAMGSGESGVGSSSSVLGVGAARQRILSDPEMFIVREEDVDT